MVATVPSPIVTRSLRAAIQILYAMSPYGLLDGRLRVRRDHETDPAQRLAQQHVRYRMSEAYIVGWVLIGVLLACYPNVLSGWWLLPVALRIVGIVNKETGVVLFGICKVSDGVTRSTADRVVSIALCNYTAMTLLFATLNAHFGAYAVPGCTAACALDIQHALIQSFSIAFSFSTAYAPQDLLGGALSVVQSGMSFFFVTLVLATFISSLKID